MPAQSFQTSGRPPDWSVICRLALAASGAALLFQFARCWVVTPNSASGWPVPILVLYFVALRWRDRPDPAPGPICRWWYLGALWAGGVVLLARLLLEPFPGWPLVEWAYAAALIALSIVVIAAWQGAAAARHFAFPLCFSLTALPWPTVIETEVIAKWRALLAELVAGFCNFVGEPAVARGTVIQLGGASIGIEEACGGIRSMQMAIIVALAAGELRRDRLRGRAGWVAAGIGLSLLSNGLRLVALTWICGKYGSVALARWHDRLDWIELGVLLGGLGAAYALLRLPPVRQVDRLVPRTKPASRSKAAVVLASGLLAVIFLSEASNWLWFRGSGSADRNEERWSARIPEISPGYAEDPFTPTMQAMLGCDAHQLAHWHDTLGARRAGFVLEWNRGQTAQFAVLNHSPDICLPAAGNRLLGSRPGVTIRRGPWELPFTCQEFSDGQQSFYVYHLAWNDTAGEPFQDAAGFATSGGAWLKSRWHEVEVRRRSVSIRVVTLAIFDAPDGLGRTRHFEARRRRSYPWGHEDAHGVGTAQRTSSAPPFDD